jgi:tripartite-type tricarboxylate transporter receptor subunit TctC
MRKLAICTAFIFTASAFAAVAQDYPTRPIRFVNSSAAGGGADVLIRFLAAKIQPLAGQPILVENKPGAGGNIANEYVAGSKPDGYTVLIAASSAMIANRYVMKDTRLDGMKDFDPVTSIFRAGFALTVPNSSPAKTVPELITFLKSKPTKVLFGSPTVSVLAASELFKLLSGTNGEPVNYKAMLDAARDVISGDVDYAFVDTVLGMGQARAGRLRVLGVTTPKRLESVPDVATVREAGLEGYEYVNFWGVWLPAKSPPDATSKLNRWFNDVIKSDEGHKFLVDQSSEPWPSTPDELRAHMVEHDAMWQKIVKQANIQPQ